MCWRDNTALWQTDGVCVGETTLPYDKQNVCWRDNTALWQTDRMCVGETTLPYDRQLECVLARWCHCRLHSIDFPVSGCQRSCLLLSLLFLLQHCRDWSRKKDGETMETDKSKSGWDGGHTIKKILTTHMFDSHTEISATGSYRTTLVELLQALPNHCRWTASGSTEPR